MISVKRTGSCFVYIFGVNAFDPRHCVFIYHSYQVCILSVSASFVDDMMGFEICKMILGILMLTMHSNIFY